MIDTTDHRDLSARKYEKNMPYYAQNYDEHTNAVVSAAGLGYGITIHARQMCPSTSSRASLSVQRRERFPVAEATFRVTDESGNSRIFKSRRTLANYVERFVAKFNAEHVAFAAR